MTESKLILVVDDDHQHAKALELTLHKFHYRTITAVNGEEGLATALDVHPDLILLDIIMPVMDGMSMVKKLREDTWGANVPLIFLTNLNENDEVKEWIQTGGYDYLIKSNYSLDDVMAKVRKKIG